METIQPNGDNADNAGSAGNVDNNSDWLTIKPDFHLGSLERNVGQYRLKVEF